MNNNEPPPPKPETQRTRVGYIARLPKALREIVNRMLDDGKPFQEIINELEKHREQWPADITALAHHHLVSWRNGGYQHWLFHQEQLDQLRAKEEFTLEFLAQTEPGELYKAGVRLAFLRVVQALHEMNLAGCGSMVFRRPSAYAALLASINRLSRLTLAFTEFNGDLEEQARAKEPRKGGISPEAQAQIDALLGLSRKHEPREGCVPPQPSSARERSVPPLPSPPDSSSDSGTTDNPLNSQPLNSQPAQRPT